MPPKKDKKKKPKAKRIRMAMPDPARFATGFNRQIPGGIIGTGIGIGIGVIGGTRGCGSTRD